ncbi:aminoglycoside adenylyltransferase family protein [Sphingobacterium faecale]|uniref:DUF4111 domain-containing protein n=1 Tax=Sphingobacterium faecale TaxID=2803775 RepID=A0ABS1R436_9SPHI|nr:aminoglycoside adenylyltransferase family protein [Sphingobacterium faecale]MBL1409045.1 DUF4111 domain-containing protein [Sphingobacterium faecale]
MNINNLIKELELNLVDNQQITEACAIISKYLDSSLLAIHLYGSAVAGGLKPFSDIDLLVTIDRPMSDDVRTGLMQRFLTCSAQPGTSANKRALEVTVINYSEVVPWKYPPRREMQFGEWLRNDILKGVVEGAVLDADLCILIKKARISSIPMVGAIASKLFVDDVPNGDFFKTLQSTLSQWNNEEDWRGDERNIILTIARIWYSASTGNIGSKEEASGWLMDRIPTNHQFWLAQARRHYLDGGEGELIPSPEEMASFIKFARGSIMIILDGRKSV